MGKNFIETKFETKERCTCGTRKCILKDRMNDELEVTFYNAEYKTEIRTAPMRDGKKAMFFKEVRSMMYGFGDVSSPRTDTVETVHNYLIDYLSLLLTKVHVMAKIKGKTKTEDLMYFLKRDRRKYSRVKNLLLTNEELKMARKMFEPKEYEKD